jgi:hypothetical protein
MLTRLGYFKSNQSTNFGFDYFGLFSKVITINIFFITH